MKYDCTKTKDCIHEYNRLCGTYINRCRDCPINGMGTCNLEYFDEDMIALLQRWSDEHPEIAKRQKKGYWHITDAYPHNVYCSECHARFAQTHWAVWEDGSLPRNYCPNCGARMDEKGE